MLVTENDYPLRWLISAWERGLKLEGLINLSTKCRGSLDRAVRAELCLADSQGQWDECLPPHSLQPWTLISCTPCTWSRAGLSLLLLRQQTLVVLIRNIPSPLSQTSIWATWKYKVQHNQHHFTSLWNTRTFAEEHCSHATTLRNCCWKSKSQAFTCLGLKWE